MKEDILKYLPIVMFRGTPCISMIIHNKDDIEFVTEFPSLLGHPVRFGKKKANIVSS